MTFRVACCIPQIEAVGEMVLDVGAPMGWGPVGLTSQQLAVCLERIRDVVNPLQVWHGNRLWVAAAVDP